MWHCVCTGDARKMGRKERDKFMIFKKIDIYYSIYVCCMVCVHHMINKYVWQRPILICRCWFCLSSSLISFHTGGYVLGIDDSVHVEHFIVRKVVWECVSRDPRETERERERAGERMTTRKRCSQPSETVGPTTSTTLYAYNYIYLRYNWIICTRRTRWIINQAIYIYINKDCMSAWDGLVVVLMVMKAH